MMRGTAGRERGTCGIPTLGILVLRQGLTYPTYAAEIDRYVSLLGSLTNQLHLCDAVGQWEQHPDP